jgi:hypothetical protein
MFSFFTFITAKFLLWDVCWDDILVVDGVLVVMINVNDVWYGVDVFTRCNFFALCPDHPYI